VHPEGRWRSVRIYLPCCLERTLTHHFAMADASNSFPLQRGGPLSAPPPTQLLKRRLGSSTPPLPATADHSVSDWSFGPVCCLWLQARDEEWEQQESSDDGDGEGGSDEEDEVDSDDQDVRSTQIPVDFSRTLLEPD
jgi:hypothetical protein